MAWRAVRRIEGTDLTRSVAAARAAVVVTDVANANRLGHAAAPAG